MSFDSIVRYNPRDKTVVEFDTIDEAAMDYSDYAQPKRSIQAALRGDSNSSFGCIWKFKKDFLLKDVEDVKVATGPLSKRKRESSERDCLDCKKTLPIENFSENRRQCRDCKNIHQEDYSSTGDGFLLRVIKNCKNSAKSRLNSGRIDAGTFELTLENVKQKLKDQNGKCYYSNIPLHVGTNKQWKLSIERLNPDLGYTVANTVLVALEFNNAKAWTLEKVNNLPALISTPVDLDTLEKNCHSVLVPLKVKRLTAITNAEGLCQCRKCHLWKEKSVFNGSQCHDCHNISNVERRSTFRGFVISLVSGSRCRRKEFLLGGRSSKRVKLNDDDEEKVMENHITLEQICAKIMRQGGRCFYSNVPLVFSRHSDWQASLERLDNSKGYEDSNTALICLEFNSTCNQTDSVGEEDTQWGIEKFKYFYATRFPNIV